MYCHELKSVEITKRKRCVRCRWCGEKIEIGDKAQYRVYTFDGFQTEYLHRECYSAMGRAKEEMHPDDYYYFCSEGWEECSFFRGTTRSRDSISFGEGE